MGEVTSWRRLTRRDARELRPLRSKSLTRAPSEVFALAIAFMLGGGAVVAYPRLAEVSLAALTEPVDAPAPAVHFTYCLGRQAPNCIVDGDTLHYRGEVIRIADIDTPEVRGFGCTAEKVRGDRATERLLTLLNAGPFEMASIDRDEDRYGRKLRVLSRDGISIGNILVAEGLARPWEGPRRSWC